MRKIKIAQIGTSRYSHGRMCWDSLAKQSDIFEFVGYCLPEGEKEKFRGFIGDSTNVREMTVEEIMNDTEIEAVAIETEEIYITKYALMAAKAGKHIHMEKPGGESLEEFEELINLMKKTGKVFHTGYMYRYNPVIKDLLKRIKAGELGDIISVEAQMNSNHPDEQRRFLKTFKGGIMFFLGCHLVDLTLLIMGKPNNIVPFNAKTGKSGIDSTDYGMAVLEYDTGASFIKSLSAELGGFARRQLVVTGTKGTIEVKPLEMHSGGTLQYTGVTEYFGDNIPWNSMGVNYKSEPYDRYDDMMATFASYVRGEGTNPYTLDYELELYKTVLKCCGML